jgi:hypothetical protein
VKGIPSGKQITRLVDEIKPWLFSFVFSVGLKILAKRKILEQYRVLGGKYTLIPLDGVWFYRSNKVFCSHCLHITRNGETTYYHDMISPALVSPDFKEVFPLMPEFIRNEDGSEKQDCERNACKRWLQKHGRAYAWLNPVYLGDDLYSDYNTCRAVLAQGAHFIFTCKPDTHQWLFSAIDEDCLNKKNLRQFTGKKNHILYRYRW